MNNSINFTSQRITFVNKISMLQKALSDDEIPTPSYLYKEINDISFESVGYCESLVEFLVDRLRHKSCHVKLKVLKLMKHVLEHGSKEFQLGLRQQVSLVKEHTKFSGPPHPVHGNTPYTLIRNLAVELCEHLYNLDPLSLKSSNKNEEEAQSPQSKYSGMGPSRSGGAIQGFGNSPASQSRSITGTILQEIEKLGTRLSETPADRQAAVLARLNLSASSSNYQPPVVSFERDEIYSQQSKEEQQAASVEHVPEKPVYHHLPGKAGGGWNDDDSDDEDDDKGGGAGSDLERSNIIESTGLDPGQEEGDGPNQNSLETMESKSLQNSLNLESEEGKVVEDLLMRDLPVASGTLSFLSNTCISEFLQTCSKLKCGVVLDFICHHLTQEDPLVLARSLQLLEGMIYNRKELVNIDVLTVRCKTDLRDCFTKAGRLASEADKTDDCCGKWRAVQLKAAKLILILQQLSSHKDILPSSGLAHALALPPSPSTLPPTGHHIQEVTS